ncbi:hypothetical protein DMUE_2134 [Dictyocoela muelleri]|nr:hypothetical protein DMUE_2134 [Dictyocoela muelleri]
MRTNNKINKISDYSFLYIFLKFNNNIHKALFYSGDISSFMSIKVANGLKCKASLSNEEIIITATGETTKSSIKIDCFINNQNSDKRYTILHKAINKLEE